MKTTSKAPKKNRLSWPNAVLYMSLGLFAASPALAEVVPTRQAELAYLLKHDCGSCHGMTMKGGLGSPLLPSVLAEKSDDDLLEIILDGIPGTPMPPWRPLLTIDEARWLVGAIRKGKKQQ